MLDFAQFLADAARKGEVVNIVYEERLFSLVGILGRIAGPLLAGGTVRPDARRRLDDPAG